MNKTLINERWEIHLPEHRANLDMWPWWEKERLAALFNNIYPGNVIWDIGAESGDISALMAMWAGPTGGVVLFEPSPNYWASIRDTWSLNDLPSPLGYFVGFASDRTDLIPANQDFDVRNIKGFPACAYEPFNPQIGFRHLNQQADATPQITLDDYYYLNPQINCDILNIDVEGSELRVLKGARNLLMKCKPLVFLAVHPDFLREQYGAAGNDVLYFLKDLGYKIHLLAIEHEVQIVARHPAGKGFWSND